PAERISDPIDKVEKSAFIEPHQITGTEPGIAGRKNIAQDLLFSIACVGIALETASADIGGSDPADGFANLAADAGNAKTFLCASGDTGLAVDANDRRRKTMRQQRRNPADRARLALHVVEREIAFG